MMFKDTHDGHTNFYCGCMSTRTYEHGICTTCGGVEREPLPAEVTDQLSNRTRKEMGLPPKPRKPSAPKQRRGEFATLTRGKDWGMELYETLTVSTHANGIIRICGNGGMIFEAQGKYVKTEVFVERTEPTAYGTVKPSNEKPSNDQHNRTPRSGGPG